MLRELLRDRCGVAAAEYVLILSIAGIVIGAAALGLGTNIAAAVGTASKVVYDIRHAPDAYAASAGKGKGNNGGNGLAHAPGQNPGSGNGNSNGNQTPGSSPSSSPGKKK